MKVLGQALAILAVVVIRLAVILVSTAIFLLLVLGLGASGHAAGRHKRKEH